MAPITLDDLRDEMAEDEERAVMSAIKMIDEMNSGSRPKFPSQKEVIRDVLVRACQFLRLQLNEALDKEDDDFLSASGQTDETPLLQDEGEKSSNQNEMNPSDQSEARTSDQGEERPKDQDQGTSNPQVQPGRSTCTSIRINHTASQGQQGDASTEDNIPNCRYHKWKERKHMDDCKFKHPNCVRNFLSMACG